METTITKILLGELGALIMGLIIGYSVTAQLNKNKTKMEIKE